MRETNRIDKRNPGAPELQGVCRREEESGQLLEPGGLHHILMTEYLWPELRWNTITGSPACSRVHSWVGVGVNSQLHKFKFTEREVKPEWNPKLSFFSISHVRSCNLTIKGNNITNN